MNKTKLLISLVLAISIMIFQVGGVFAAPASQVTPPIDGIVQSITLATNPSTGITIVIVSVMDSNQELQTVRISQETAITLGLVALDSDGKPSINDLALGQKTEINPKAVIPEKEETQHPVGSALATFFSDVAGIDYDAIMSAHDEGFGFGVIAQALWLTTKLEGNSDIFQAILDAKKTGDYSDFVLEDGTTPRNWGQLRKIILEKQNNPGIVMSNKDNGNGNNQAKGKNKNEENEKNNNGNGNGNNR